MTSMVKFKYEIKVGSNSGFVALLKNDRKIPKVDEVEIYSREFDTFSEAQDNMSRALSYFANIEGRSSGKNYVVMCKSNPELTPDQQQQDAHSWNEFTLLRMYIADADRLKSAELAFDIFGQIVADHEISVATQVYL